MNIKKHYLTNNECYIAGMTMKVKGIMLHSVGCNVENPMNFIISWDKKGIYKCVHAFIGKDVIYETLPYNYKGWHCGKGIKGSFNNGYLGIEICEPKSITYTSGGRFVDNDKNYTKEFVLATYKNAVEYFVYLCKNLKINPIEKNVIVSHSEGYNLGYASNHGDVEHIWSYIGLDMDTFRKDVCTMLSQNIYVPKNKEHKNIIRIDDNNIDTNKKENQNKTKDTMKNVKLNINNEKQNICEETKIKIISENMMINKKLEKINTIKIDNYNYVKIDDLKKLGMNISYDKINKLVSIDFI